MSDFGFINLIKEISNASYIVHAIALSTNAMPVAPVSNRKINWICFLFFRIHGVTNALLVNKLLSNKDDKIYQ